MRLTALADVARRTGWPVVEHAGWQTSGGLYVDVPPVQVVHHTASSATSSNVASLGWIATSSPLAPLSNFLVGRDGTIVVVAAGVTNNSGVGTWAGVSGNRNTIGIEIENSGLPGDSYGNSYPASVALSAELCREYGTPLENVIGHKEWAPDRKVDPSFDMNQYRADVFARLEADMPLSEDDVNAVAVAVGPVVQAVVKDLFTNDKRLRGDLREAVYAVLKNNDDVRKVLVQTAKEGALLALEQGTGP